MGRELISGHSQEPGTVYYTSIQVVSFYLKWKRIKRAAGVKYMVTEGDDTLDGGQTMEYINIVLYSCTPEMHIVLLTKVTTVHLIKKRRLAVLKQKCSNSLVCFKLIILCLG